jgi:Uma2 family endonuclease
MVVTTELKTSPTTLNITYEPLPHNYKLEEIPVENTGQPLIAGALREILELNKYITSEMLIASNFGLCVTVNEQLSIKAPDWVYVPKVKPLAEAKDRKSYTPYLEGENPEIVIEFLSENYGGEYSRKSIFPYGKWYFYEQILKIPTYVIFDPADGSLEVYNLKNGKYELPSANEQGLYWLESMQLYIGVWNGTKEERNGFWLRFWDKSGIILPWATEVIDQERLKAEKLAAYLRSQGINPDEIL